KLEAFRKKTGLRLSLLEVVSEHLEVKEKIGGRSFNEVATGFMKTVASVKRKDIAAAVAEFLLLDEPRTKSMDGKRAQLSSKYAYNRKLQLNKFAGFFP